MVYAVNGTYTAVPDLKVSYTSDKTRRGQTMKSAWTCGGGIGERVKKKTTVQQL
jgi:hypothetical protein